MSLAGDPRRLGVVNSRHRYHDVAWTKKARREIDNWTSRAATRDSQRASKSEEEVIKQR